MMRHLMNVAFVSWMGAAVAGDSSLAAAQRGPISAGDSAPIRAVDACVLTSTLIPFELFSRLLSQSVEAALDRITARWHAVGGYILVVGHGQTSELDANDPKHLDVARAEVVRDAFIGRGVPASYVWARAADQPRPVYPRESPDDRFAAVFLTGGPSVCMAGIQRLRLNWVLQHCIESDQPTTEEKESCAAVLNDNTYNQGK